MEAEKPKAEAAAGNPNFFYAATLILSLGVAATPFILSAVAGRSAGVGWMDAVAALVAGILFWTSCLLGLVKSIRIFGCLAGGALAAGVATPLALLVFLNRPEPNVSGWTVTLVFAAAFAGAALVLWIALGFVSTRIDRALKNMRAAQAMDYLLGAAFGLLLLVGLSFVYSVSLPDMTYTSFWLKKANQTIDTFHH